MNVYLNMCILNITNLILRHILFTLYIIFFIGAASHTRLVVKKLKLSQYENSFFIL